MRSTIWFEGESEHAFAHRSAMRAMGHLPESYLGKPIIGIFNSWNDFNGCNLPHKELVEHVKRGVLLAGGYPMELFSISAPSEFMKPSDLPYRNLMAMDIEEQIRSLPIDGVILLCECDKTTPAGLMAAASCDVPSLALAAGHRTSGTFRGRIVNYGTDLWKYFDEYRAGSLDTKAMSELEGCINCGLGGCPVMGTASTMKSLAEMLGLMLPGTASLPSGSPARKAAAQDTGRRIVEMVKEDLRPSCLLTREAFGNAIRLLAALGGSTNAVIHLIALAGRLGIRLELQEFAQESVDLPLLVNLQPSGEHNMDAFDRAGGTAAVIGELLPRLYGDCLMATGRTVRDVYGLQHSRDPQVITSLGAPFQEDAGIAVLVGNLSPSGAVLKRSAGSPALLKHRGHALVFDGYEDMMARVDSEELEVEESSVLVLRDVGPVAMGMPEWGMIPIPAKLLRQGVRDMVRISDARMSGTSFGTVVLHVAPEAAVGGPLAIVRDGDVIELDALAGSLRLLLDEEEIAERLKAWRPGASPHKRGYMRLFQETVQQANYGCDLDFLQPRDPSEAVMVPPIVGRG